MPYSSVDDLPSSIKDKLKSPKKRRQFVHIWNSSFDEHKDESRAFASAWSAVKKFHVGIAEMDDNLNFFMPICKIDKEKRTASGYASTNCVDSDGEVVSQDAIKAALPDYMQFANIREMHRPWAVGVANEANHDGRGLYITAKIVDDAAWKKVAEGVYKGFSIGGKKLAKVGNTITKIGLSEISIVDRPANPDCVFTVQKMAGSDADAYLLSGEELQKTLDVDEKSNPEAVALRKAKKKAKKLAKREAKKSAPPSPSATHDADGGAEAASGKSQSRHELGLEKTIGDGGDLHLARLSSSEGDDLIQSKLHKVKGRKMPDDPANNNAALTKALIQMLTRGQAPQVSPALGLIKAADGDVKSMKQHRRDAEDCVKSLFDMHKGALAKSTGSFDHDTAIKLVQKLYSAVGMMKQLSKSARENLEKAAGRVSAPGTVEDGISGLYTPDPGGQLLTISPGEMDNLPAHKGGGDAIDLAKYVPKELVDALTRNAKLEAENALLKAMPASPSGGRRPAGYDFSKFAGDTSGSNVLLKGINPVDLESGDQSTRETAFAKMVGNLILGGPGMPVVDPNFHGTAGFGKPN